ncbi:tripartite motif-containing protein 3 [Plakobranchus ocellatus]|uniref:Tripartite motif-containing protein 3 n=1 Tax=Plakobranchus ocellatus TaxID=259542 RepID=A0AAV3Y0A4_9GAST|nr:tripartite motif-containing protein 3 [Plakobranchus ocellatus]
MNRNKLYSPLRYASRMRMSSSDNPGASAASRGGTAGGAGAGAGGGAAAPVAAAAGTSNESGRSLIVDESFFEEQFLKCQVCHERFDQGERSPKSLPCNHTFCLPCLTQIFDHAQPPARRNLLWADQALDGALKCPTCRVEIFLSRSKIKDLPNDHRVVQMMDFLSQAVAKSHNVCSKHDRQPLNFFCKKCLVPVCRDCTVLDHKDSEGHVIIDVSEAMSENSTQFTEIEKKSRDTLEKMKARSDSLANASKRLDITERRLRADIKETFIEYRLLLEKRQEALTGMVRQIVQDQKAKINARFVNVCEHGTQLQKLYDEFKASKNSNDLRSLFTIMQQMKDHEVQFAQVATADDNDYFQSCEFEAQNEGSFLSDLSGLGEVRSRPDPELKEPVPAQQLVYLDMEEQRERQRLIESQLGNYRDCDEEDLMGARATNAAAEAILAEYEAEGYGEPPEEEDEEEATDYWPGHSALMSRLISHYARHRGNDAPEAMDEEDETGISGGHRRSAGNHRRGRRSRDTNSSQVSSSLSQERQNDLELLRAARAAATGSGSGGSSRYSAARSGSGGRNRGSERAPSSSEVRIIRHLSSSRPSFGPGDN